MRPCGEKNLNVNVIFNDLACGFNCHRLCSHLTEKCETKRTAVIFGVPIDTDCLNHDHGVPLLIKLCLDEVEKRGLGVEGVYRRSGPVIQVNYAVEQSANSEHLQAMFRNTENPLDITTIASLVKKFFTELPSSLIPPVVFNKMLNAIDRENDASKLAYFKDCIQMLIFEESATLALLMHNLYKYLQFNKCTAEVILKQHDCEKFGACILKHTNEK